MYKLRKEYLQQLEGSLNAMEWSAQASLEFL